jgi:hypothetical protein
LRQTQSQVFATFVLIDSLDKAAQNRRIVTRAELKAFMDDDRSEFRVEDCSAKRILETADKYRLIDE